MAFRRREITPFRAAVAVYLVATATIAAAWLFQLAGYLPCELCLKERWPYYAGVPLAALVIVAAGRGRNALARPGLVLLALIFAGSAVFGAYHAGVEWKFWPGPSECTGALDSASFEVFKQQLQHTKVVPCDAAAIRLLGVSLAGWNALFSVLISAMALAGAASRRPAK